MHGKACEDIQEELEVAEGCSLIKVPYEHTPSIRHKVTKTRPTTQKPKHGK
jgi:hypothetical protein